MATRKAPSPSSVRTNRLQTVKAELESLYLRRRAVENLIESIETYCRLREEIENKSSRAA